MKFAEPPTNMLLNMEPEVASNGDFKIAILPFKRCGFDKFENPEQCQNTIKMELFSLMKKLSIESIALHEKYLDGFIQVACKKLYEIWKSRSTDSEAALEGLQRVLEMSLAYPMNHYDYFDVLMDSIGFGSILFWKNSVPLIYESDLSSGTQYRDALLFSLELFDVNNGKNKVRELYAAVPGVQQSLLGVHAKRFEEKFKFLQTNRSRRGSRMSSTANSSSNEDLPCLNPDQLSEAIQDELSNENNAESGGLADIQQTRSRVINVSNAPPVSVSRKMSGTWEIKQGSGGLVACVDPVMSTDKENIWLANLGFNVNQNADTELDANTNNTLPSTNSLGLPLIKQSKAGDVFHVLGDDKKKNDLSDDSCEKDMTLLSVLHDYNKSSYKLNPVIVTQDDYDAYYGGISNGLLWPALHNLGEYIAPEYDNISNLKNHWYSYVRVNYQFALNAARNSRHQDFIWIHDYHLMLTGQMMKSLDSSLEVGFFLHIPFQPPHNFMTKYKVVAEPIIRGILRFNKVGFQTHRDRQKYVELVKTHIKRVKIMYDSVVDIYMIAYDGSTCSIGVFPVSIKNQDFIDIAKKQETIDAAVQIKNRFASKCHKDGKLFLSVERFDYTKGIKQKLLSWKLYFEKYPERVGRDTFFQVAVTNRRTVDSYRQYQDDCISLAEQINAHIISEEFKDWKPVVFQTDGLVRKDLIANYLAMDVGVVTPVKDGMNLVAKEMMICNPSTALVLSTGAGTEVQFTNAGLYEDVDQCYFRVENIDDFDHFADIYYKAATQTPDERIRKGAKIKAFLMKHDIVEWSTTFLDPSWTHEVIRPDKLITLSDFYTLMDKTCKTRRLIVENVLKGIAMKSHYEVSLRNAKESLLKSCLDGDTTLEVNIDNEFNTETMDSPAKAHLKIADQIEELSKDIEFLSFVQSQDVKNVEFFVETLVKYHPISDDAFEQELNSACELLASGDHYDFFFTDRDGTLKSYSCSYASSIQPAYSGVIQAQFARRCAQFCAIVTSSPLLNTGILNVSTMPEGYFIYGASAGREWYMNPSIQFKDSKISANELELIDNVFEKIEDDLLTLPEYNHLKWIGSGIQKHYGHITIACQDGDENVTKQRTLKLFEIVKNIVLEVDPTEVSLVVVDNLSEIKIFIREDSSDTIFNKGDGILLIQQKMGLKLHKGKILICGDAATDLPMLEVCLKISPANVYTIWVTQDENLKKQVLELCKLHNNKHYSFVSCPTVLLSAMAHATVRDIRNRPHIIELDDYN
uniref:T6PP_N domain-containing protein n=1 Tax=Rhabditophanes sp. KR3021 TaxID=114890 RepID=A0AC35U6A1_9BILA